MRRIPPLARLRTFEVAARLQSFAQAAQVLSLTPSAVSHQMRELEGHFGCALFVRSHRRVQPTPQGRRLQDSLTRVFDALEAACAEVTLPGQDQVLAVYCAPSLAIKWLGPRLPEFLAAHPGLNVRLTTGAATPDLAQVRDVQVAVTYGEPPPPRPGVDVVPLDAERIAPLVSPALVPPRARPDELVRRLTLIDSTLSPVAWPHWFEHQGWSLPAAPRPAFDRAAMAIAAAADGLGVALESTRLAARELERGDLVELGRRSFRPVERTVHFVSVRRGERARPGVEAFVEWVVAAAGAGARDGPPATPRRPRSRPQGRPRNR